MRILLVELDPETSAAIRTSLRKRYVVDSVHSRQEMIELAQDALYDIYVLDFGLPQLETVQMCGHLRSLSDTVPILVLTSSRDSSTKVLALDTGADDCLAKPFDDDELFARLRALLRRGTKTLQENNFLKAGDLLINLSQGEAFHRGILLPLRRKEFLLLEYFIRHAGRILTRDILLEYVWESNSDPMTNTVDVHIKFLRDKIDKPFGTNHIRTVHGMGYKFVTNQR